MIEKGEKEPIELVCPVQHYQWGCGPEGLVAKLSGEKSDQPCAELWMGTHPSGPSKLPNRQLLSTVCGDLPFLFKVLSVRTALSIQAHPDEGLARELHQRDPRNYPDPHHKPELAIAVGRFEAFLGFRKMKEIQETWRELPELSFLAMVSEDTTLKEIFVKIIKAEKEKALLVADKLLERKDIHQITLFKRLWQQYPHDVGCFAAAFLLNHVTLEDGEAVFLAANEPHAYLSGQCIECMAASDNVVRAGLTPKFRDLDTLLSMLTYKEHGVGELKLTPKTVSKQIARYSAPIDEFAVERIRLDAHENVTIKSTNSPAIIIFINGDGMIAGKPYKPGSVYFLPPKSEQPIKGTASTLAFRAYSPRLE